MDELEAVPALRALGEPTRLRLMLLLANAPHAMAAGDLAQKLGVRQNTLSAHVSALARTGMIVGHRHGRNILYSTDARNAGRLAAYLLTSLCKVSKNKMIDQLTRFVGDMEKAKG